MSTREIRLHHLVGRRVRDADDRPLGRLEELRAEIELYDGGNAYVVVEFHVGIYGLFEALAGGRFARTAFRRLGIADRYVVPWEWLDLSDPARPRVTRPQRELRRE